MRLPSRHTAFPSIEATAWACLLLAILGSGCGKIEQVQASQKARKLAAAHLEVSPIPRS